MATGLMIFREFSINWRYVVKGDQVQYTVTNVNTGVYGSTTCTRHAFFTAIGILGRPEDPISHETYVEALTVNVRNPDLHLISENCGEYSLE